VKERRLEEERRFEEERKVVRNSQNRNTNLVKFMAKAHLSFGETLGLIGSGHSLGSWNLQNIKKLEWNVGNIWEGSFEVDNNDKEVEFKFLIITSGQVIWEPGNNHILPIGVTTVEEYWGT